MTKKTVKEYLEEMVEAVKKMPPEELAKLYKEKTKDIDPEDYKPYAQIENYIIGKHINGYGEAPKHLSKNSLINFEYYKGGCRNAEYAIWSEKLSSFVYMRTKFGDTFAEAIKHPEDDDGFDLFFPFERIKHIKDVPEKNRVGIKEIHKLAGDCHYFFFDPETMKEVTPEMEKIIEDSFPVEHYGEDILWYEGWPLRKILLQSMVMGAWVEKNKKEKK